MIQFVVKALFVATISILLVVMGAIVISAFPIWSTSAIGWLAAIGMFLFLIAVALLMAMITWSLS